MSSLRIALATCADLPRFDPDNALLWQALCEAGADVTAAVWNDPAIDWSRFDRVLIRSTWDYTDHYDAFCRWVGHVGECSTLLNPADIVLWNSDKRYLRDLADEGLPVVPTAWIDAPSTPGAWDIALPGDWDRVVIKPSISASGNRTFLSDTRSWKSLQTEFSAIHPKSAVMIQPYLASVAEAGERSLMYLNGQLMHSVYKIPGQGEFRVHEHLGGKTRLYVPGNDEMALGQRVLETVAQRFGAVPEYARVDLMLDAGGKPCLSEVELVEPSLYLVQHPPTTAAWTQRLRQCLSAAGAPLNP